MIHKLLPCPFCGDPMEDRGYGAIHVANPTCPISVYAIDRERWNRRAAPLVAALSGLDALQSIANLPTPANEDVMCGHEEAYRAVEGLFETPPFVEVDVAVGDILPTLHSEKTPEGGVIRLAKWPEGYVLWYHGKIVWKSWQ